MDSESEILRLRDWRHDEVDPLLRAHMLRIELLEADMKTLKPSVASMLEDDRIEKGVNLRIRNEHTLRFTRLQRFGALALGLVSLAGVVSNWWHP